MLYGLLWFLTRWMGVIQHRRVHVQGADLVPRNKPVLLAVNHTNAFWDAMLTAAALPRAQRVRFLTRGDVFRHAVAGKVLRNIGLLPVYRFRDGYAQLKGNTATFAASIDCLRQNGTVLIFPEGQCQPIPQLQTLMRGAARLATQAIAAGAEDLQVVPVSLTFSEHGRFRADVGIRFGASVPAVELFGRSTENAEAEAGYSAHDLRAFTERLGALMLEQSVHLDALSLRPALAEAVPAAGSADGWKTSDGTWMEARRQTAERFNKAPETAQHWMERRDTRRESGLLPPWVGPFGERLRTTDLPSTRLPAAWPLEPPRHAGRRLVAVLVPVVLLLPIALLARILHAIALGMTERIIRHKVRDPQFVDSLRAVLGMAFFGLQALLVAAVCSVVLGLRAGVEWALAAWLLLPLLYFGSLWTLRLEERWREWRRPG